MSRQSLLYLLCLSFNLLWAQEKIPPWIIIPCDQVPDTIYFQEQIDEDIQEELLDSGLEHRYTYCVKFQLDSMQWDTNTQGHQISTMEVPREPDSIEIVDVRITTFDLDTPPTGNSFLSLYALDYGSTIWATRSSATFGISIAPMPDGMGGRNFLVDSNLVYGYILQWITPWFGPLNTSDKASTLNGVHLYPNPTADWINLEWNEGEEKIHQIEIFDGLGRLVKLVALENRNDLVQIETGDLVNGSYWMTLRDNKGRVLGREQFQKLE